MAKPGDPFLDVYTAAWYNKVDKRVNKANVGIPALRNLSQQSYIWVANHEAVAKDQFTVVALSAPKFLTSDRLDNITNETVWETTDLSTGDPDNIFILLDPLPAEIGAEARVLVCGVTLLKVDEPVIALIDPIDSNYLRWIDLGSNIQLRSTKVGRIQIIQRFADLDETLGYSYFLVCVGKAVDSFYRLVHPTADIANNSYGDAEDEDWSPTRTISILNRSGDTLLQDTVVKVFFNAAIEQWEYYPDSDISDLVTIRFTLTGNLTSTGNATISATSDSTNWPTTTAIIVTNYTGYDSYTGAVGTAILIGAIWFVVEVNRPAPLVEATVTCKSHDWTSGDSARGFTADATSPITFSSPTAIGSFPTNFLHSSLNLTNSANLPFLLSDKVIATKVDEDTYDIVEIKRQKCLRFRFVLTADAPTGLTPNLTGTAICPINNDSGPPPSGSLTLKDIYGVAHNAKSGHKGVACYDFNNDWYFVEHCQHIATRFIGTLQATLSGSAATISVTPVSALNGILPSGTQTVKNTYLWADGTTGHKIAVEWNPDLAQWETYQMRCPS